MDQCAVNGYVIKPFTADVLTKKIQPVIDQMAQGQKKSGGFFGRLAAKLS
jgi:hypothetical protein